MNIGKDPEESCFEPCDEERIFELADGNLEPEEASKVRRHLDRCPPCNAYYRRQIDLDSDLRSANLFGERASCSVYRGVAMALPTRSPLARMLWAALAAALLILALAYMETNNARLVMLATEVLAAGWGFVAGSADVVRAVLAAAGSTLLFVLLAGALADLVIALALLWRHKARGA